MEKTSKPIQIEQGVSGAKTPAYQPPKLLTLYRNYENGILGAISVLIFLAIWELVVTFGWAKPLLVSSPTRIFTAAQWLFAHGFLEDIRISATEFFVGYAVAVGVGIPLGILLGWYRRLYATFDPFVSALYATPRVALLPLLILWLGIGLESKMAVVFLGAFFPVLVNTLAGVRTIDEQLLKCARCFGATDRQIFTTLALPSSIPFVVTGMRLGAGRGLVGVVVGELVAATGGVGYVMSTAGATFQTDKVFVGIILLATSGYVMVELLKRIERRFDYWRPERG